MVCSHCILQRTTHSRHGCRCSSMNAVGACVQVRGFRHLLVHLAAVGVHRWSRECGGVLSRPHDQRLAAVWHMLLPNHAGASIHARTAPRLRQRLKPLSGVHTFERGSLWLIYGLPVFAWQVDCSMRCRMYQWYYHAARSHAPTVQRHAGGRAVCQAMQAAGAAICDCQARARGVHHRAVLARAIHRRQLVCWVFVRFALSVQCVKLMGLIPFDL